MQDLTDDIANLDLTQDNLDVNKLMKNILEIINKDEDDWDEDIDQTVMEARREGVKRVLVSDEKWNLMNKFAKTAHIKKLTALALRHNKKFNKSKLFKNIGVGKYYLVYVK